MDGIISEIKIYIVRSIFMQTNQLDRKTIASVLLRIESDLQTIIQYSQDCFYFILFYFKYLNNNKKQKIKRFPN